MRILYIIAIALCVVGCSQVDPAMSTDTPAVTLNNLVHLDASSSDTQHPLVCGAGRDFPAGRELAFKGSQSEEFVHAVFPEGITPPEILDNKLILHGRYQTIQNRKSYTLKKPPSDYRYFVVSSWENRK